MRRSWGARVRDKWGTAGPRKGRKLHAAVREPSEAGVCARPAHLLPLSPSRRFYPAPRVLRQSRGPARGSPPARSPRRLRTLSAPTTAEVLRTAVTVAEPKAGAPRSELPARRCAVSGAPSKCGRRGLRRRGGGRREARPPPRTSSSEVSPQTPTSGLGRWCFSVGEVGQEVGGQLCSRVGI